MPALHGPRRALSTRAVRLCAAALALAASVALGWGTGAQARQPAFAPSPAPAPAGDDSPSATGDVISVQEIARLQGQGESVLRGIGIVTGLRGTGDAGSELVLARPLAKIYEANGNPLPDLKELAKAKSAAIVMIEAVVPAQGARRDDRLDVYVTVSHSAASLAGGRLFLAPLSGPLPGQGVFAMASGALVIEDPASPTVAVIRGGARAIQDVLMPGVGDTLELIVKPPFRHYSVTDQLASTINALGGDVIVPAASDGAAPPGATAYGEIARAQDDVSVRVVIPEPERANPSAFIAKVMGATFSPSLLRLPAQVVVNARTGSIIVTGNVELSPVAIAHKDLVITIVTPPPVGTPVNPLVETKNWTGLGTAGRAGERSRIQDLIQAFRQLDIPIQEQINILFEINRTGRLHAELIVE